MKSKENGNDESKSNTIVDDVKENMMTRRDQDTNDLEMTEQEYRRNQIRYRGRVAYDGTGFRGWQVQAKGRTCQGQLEAVLSRRFNRQIRVLGAGRTDAGVHARGQAFHFDLNPSEIKSNNNTNIDKTLNMEIETDEESCDDDSDDGGDAPFCKELQKSMNSMLPPDIRIWKLSRAPPPSNQIFHEDGTIQTTKSYHRWSVMYMATKKLYSYRLTLPPHGITNDPIQRYTRVHVQHSQDECIDVGTLERILKCYEGEHDFRAFAGAIEANQRKSGVETKNTVRTVYSVNLVKEAGNGNYRIDILLKGALYKMVRNMVGTALEVCKGRMDEEYFLTLLHHNPQSDSDDGNGDESARRQFVRKDNKCKPVDPEGLTLEMVFFDNDPDGF